MPSVRAEVEIFFFFSLDSNASPSVGRNYSSQKLSVPRSSLRLGNPVGIRFVYLNILNT